MSEEYTDMRIMVGRQTGKTVMQLVWVLQELGYSREEIDRLLVAGGLQSQAYESASSSPTRPAQDVTDHDAG